MSLSSINTGKIMCAIARTFTDPKYALGLFKSLPLWSQLVLGFGAYTKARRLFAQTLLSKSLAGQTAVITGAGSGIGRLMAIKLSGLGVKVALWDISPGVAGVADEINKAGGTAKSYVGDVCNRENVYKSAEEVKKEFGQVDILINNAGIVSGKTLLDVPDGLAEKTVQVNTISHFWTTKAFLPDMIERDSGHIVTIASASSLVGVAGLCDYAASKFGAKGFAESLRLELRKLKKWGVKTTVVCPYFINTGMFDGVKTNPIFILLGLNILEPQYVADETIAAVQRNCPEIRLPYLMYASDAIHFFFPVWAKDTIFEILGFSSSMDNFKQTRPVAKSFEEK
ncbi:hypothetical protein TeGR_g8095 [Tetraparma gracilis]|uniref:Uncharacterized protein n=1 Tax=Tetraparma gracilis TaxID=2962635 RepID=A0ABQ6MR98_9STRA|nr:hypothetical protein TeGR_g8095 [Tetraparma gracilis]